MGNTSDAQPVPPRTAAELAAWLNENLGITVPRTPLLDGSSAPFDYLLHTYFEGAPPPHADAPTGAAAPADSPAEERPDTAHVLDPRPGDCVVWANRGGGKTFLGAVATVLDLVFKPGIQVRILGGSLEQSQRMHRYLRTLLERPALAELVDGRLGLTDRRARLINGSCAEVLAASETSVRGTRVQKLRCDEVDLFDRDVWDAAQLTTRSIPCNGPWGKEVRGWVEALSTMHRPMGLMWDIVASAQQAEPATGGAAPARPVRRLFRWGVVDVLETCDPLRNCHTCDLHDECGGRAKERCGPAGHLSIPDAIAMKRRVGAETWRAEMLCLGASRSDSVFPEFDPAAHVFSSDDGAAGAGEVVCGMDFGFREPTVILFARHADDGVLRIVDEAAATETILDRHIQTILRWPGGPVAWVAVDPAGTQCNGQSGIDNVAVMRTAGLTVHWRPSQIHPGIMRIRARLRPAIGGPRLLVHARCSRLIEALTRYHYDPNSPRSLTPVKDGHDHAADALRYLVTWLDAGRRSEVGTYTG